MANASRWIATLATLLVAGFLASPAALAGQPRCFGAASRDPYVSCQNPALAHRVTPTPEEAVIVPNAPCYPLPGRTKLEHAINACTFGRRQAPIARTVALLGNSHAAHWRAAVAVAAKALHWYGVSITRSSCPFLWGAINLPEPARRQCVQWHRNVVAWFATHPKVETVFVSDQPTPVVNAGSDVTQGEATAFMRGWAALPKSVKHIIVIRDSPYIHPGTLPCVTRAIARREDAGVVCAVPRSESLQADPEVIAAEELNSPRVQVIDLSSYFCSSTLCFPVIGGALVFRDEGHLTRVFAATLGQPLLHALSRLMAGWG
jgi:hypothetical protein